MKVIRMEGVPKEEQTWERPGGVYRRFSQYIAGGEGTPFDAELVTLPPGATNWPYHAHSTMWEFYIVKEGSGQVKSPEGLTDVIAGDCIMHPPGEPHNLTNTGSTDLVYFIIADNTPDKTTIHEG
jgi:mannose-6-phosphate isomerase-like protein (cupin superfamily)